MTALDMIRRLPIVVIIVPIVVAVAIVAAAGIGYMMWSKRKAAVAPAGAPNGAKPEASPSQAGVTMTASPAP